MKKFYSLMLAAATTIAASAGVGNFAPTFEKVDFSKKTPAALSEMRQSSFRAPAYAAGNNAPASLEGKSAVVNFNYVQTNSQTGEVSYIPFSNTVTFSGETDNNGEKVYSMTSFFEGIFNEKCSLNNELMVVYYPESGELYLIGNQTYMTFTNGATVQEFSLWCQSGSTTSWSCINPCFSYENGTFNLVNPAEVYWQGEEEPEIFEIGNLGLGSVEGNSLSLACRLVNDINIQTVDGTGNMTWVMTNNSGPQNKEATVAAQVNGSTVTIMNFAGMFNVPMAIDLAAKTLTATNVQVTSITDYKAYLSEQAADGSNVSSLKKYVLTSTFTVADGKTTIAVPNWNAFFYQFGEDVSYFWPMTNTSIVLDFDLAEVASAGVEGIAADAEFDANAPVEYFNLQGIRVAAPEAGQLLIKVQGKKAEKVVIR